MTIAELLAHRLEDTGWFEWFRSLLVAVGQFIQRLVTPAPRDVQLGMVL